MHVEFVIPGTLGPRITASRSLFGNLELTADGQRLKKHGWFNQSVWVVASDGKTHQLKLGGGLFTTSAEVDGQKLVLEPPMPLWQRALMLAPFALVAIGGLIGGLFAGLALELNRRLARSQMRLPLKVVSMITVPLVATALWFGTVSAIGWYLAPVPEFSEGSCYAGWWEASETLTAGDLREVGCEEPHDAEVAGRFRLSDGAYPGPAAITDWAVAFCPGLFESHVGLAPERSSLQLQWAFPTEELWGRGGRSVDCFVVGAVGEVWDGSARGSFR